MLCSMVHSYNQLLKHLIINIHLQIQVKLNAKWIEVINVTLCSGDGYGWEDLCTKLAGWRSFRRLREKPQTHFHRGPQSAGDPKHAGGLGPFWWVQLRDTFNTFPVFSARRVLDVVPFLGINQTLVRTNRNDLRACKWGQVWFVCRKGIKRDVCF